MIAAADAATIQLFSFLSISDAGFSAPVVINMGSAAADVTFHAFQSGQLAGSATVNVSAGRPVAQLTSALFPDLSGDLYVVAESSQPLLGVAFIFNSLREPSMANAVALSSVPNPDSGGGGPTVSFANDVQSIITASCGGGGCHLGSSGNGAGLDLREGQSYDNLVNINATGPTFTDLFLVAPGDPGQQLLLPQVVVLQRCRLLRQPHAAQPLGPERRTAADHRHLDHRGCPG